MYNPDFVNGYSPTNFPSRVFAESYWTNTYGNILTSFTNTTISNGPVTSSNIFDVPKTDCIIAPVAGENAISISLSPATDPRGNNINSTGFCVPTKVSIYDATKPFPWANYNSNLVAVVTDETYLNALNASGNLEPPAFRPPPAPPGPGPTFKFNYTNKFTSPYTSLPSSIFVMSEWQSLVGTPSNRINLFNTDITGNKITSSNVLNLEGANIQLSDKTVNAGSQYEIVATINAPENSTIVWSQIKDNETVSLDNISYYVTNGITGTTITSRVNKTTGLAYEGDAGTYICTVTPTYGSPVTAVMALTVNPVPPIISSIFGGGAYNLGTSTTFVPVLSQGSLPITYTWYFKPVSDPNYNIQSALGTPILGETNNYFVIPSVDYVNGGKYTCIATNSLGSGSTGVNPPVSAELQISELPTIQPIASQTVLPNTTVQFVCNATGTQPLGYQWKWNGNPIAETSPIYKITSVTAANAGTYTCTVSNMRGSVVSNDVKLAVFTTASNSIIDAKTINSGSGYIGIPSTVITGGSGSGAVVSLIPDRQYIRRIVLNNRSNGRASVFSTKPVVTISGGGNTGASAVAITTSVPTDYSIQSISIPGMRTELSNLFPPVFASIDGSGSGCTLDVNTEPTSVVGSGIYGIRDWADMNYLSGPSIIGNKATDPSWAPLLLPYQNTTDFLVGKVWGISANGGGKMIVPDYLNNGPGQNAINLPKKYPGSALMAAPCYIVKNWESLSGDVTVTSRDGNGSGCTATLSFNNITYTFYNNGLSPQILNQTDGYTTIYSPVITITNPGQGYTTTPKFEITRLETDTSLGEVIRGWFLINAGFTEEYQRFAIGGSTPLDFPIFTGIGNSESGQRIGNPGPYSEFTPNNILSQELIDFMNGGPFPVAVDGGAVRATGAVDVTAVYFKTIGSGYVPGNTNLVVSSSAWTPPPGNYQSAPTIPPNNNINTTGIVTVVQPKFDYLLDSIGIESQGNGFTSTPTITVTGEGDTCVAVAEMSCFALGPITLSDPNKFYTSTPIIDITTLSNSENSSKPTVVAIMEDAGTLTSIVVNNPLLNNYSTTFSEGRNNYSTMSGFVNNYFNDFANIGRTGFTIKIDPSPSSSGTPLNGIETVLNNNNFPVAQVDPINGFKLNNRVSNSQEASLAIQKVKLLQGATGYTTTPKVTFDLGAYGPSGGSGQSIFSNESVPVRLQAILSRKIAKIVVIDNKCGYNSGPISGNILNSDGTTGDTFSCTGHASNFTASIKNRGGGYFENTSTLKNSKFIQCFDFTTNNGFTSVPTVTSSDGIGQFSARINQFPTYPLTLSLTSGGTTGYTVYRDQLTNIVNNTVAINITPHPLDLGLASGASATPVITGSIGGLLFDKPVKQIPWLPDYRPTWAGQNPYAPARPNYAGFGWNFQITNEPGCSGSGLTLRLVTKTAAQLGYTYKGAPISPAAHFTSPGQMLQDPGNGANWYPWVNATHPNPYTWPMGFNLWTPDMGYSFGTSAMDQGNVWAERGCPFLVGVEIETPGSGYTSPPTIRFVSGGKPEDDIFIGSFIRGPITGLKGRNPGINYRNPPIVSVVNVGPSRPQPSTLPLGSGAVITPAVSTEPQGVPNTIQNIFIRDQGRGWTGATPTIIIRGPTGAIGTATPVMGASYMRVTMGEGGLYTREPSVIITDAVVNGVPGPGRGAFAVPIMLTIPSGSTGSTGPAGGSPNAGKLTVSGVMFANYGTSYVNPKITFVRDPFDSPGVNATAQADMVYDSMWPSIATAVPSDSFGGKGGLIGLKVSTALCIAGTTGPVQGVVQIPNTVTGILDDALSNLTEMTSLVFQSPSKCKVIGDPVFGGCTGLKSVYLPESMQEIQSKAFLGCTSLDTVVIEGNTGPLIYPDAFEGCSPDLTVYTSSEFTEFSSRPAAPGFVDATVTAEIINAKPRVIDYVGTAAYKAILSDTVFNGASVTSDPYGNIYGPYYNNYGYSVYSYFFDTTNTLVNPTPIIPLNTQINGEWVGFVQAVWKPVVESTTGGLFMLGIPNYQDGTGDTGNTVSSLYYKSLDSLPTDDPIVIFDKITQTFTTFTIDNNENLIFINTSDSSPLSVLRAPSIASAITSGGGSIEPLAYGTLNELNTEVPSAIACDANGYIYAALSDAGVVIRYDPYSVNSDPEAVLFASGFSKPCALAFDSVGNLYVGNGDDQKLDGISVVSAGTTNTVSTVMNGFSVLPRSMTYNTPDDKLVFSDGYNLCCMALTGNTTAPVSLIQALATHDYTQMVDILTSMPGETFILTVNDINSINSTLSADSQVELPTGDPVSYIVPNLDQSVTVPVGEPETSIFVATSLPPEVSTIMTIGVDVVTVVSNLTSPPTLTVSGPGVIATQTVQVGESFNTVSGTTVTLYSIGLTVFGAVYGALFVPGVGGVPPAVCKPKRQGIDYGHYISSQLSNADVQSYKQARSADMSEWVRRQRVRRSVKFGACSS